MAYDNARPLPPVPDAPHHDKHLKPWVVAGLTVIIVLGIVAWNMQELDRYGGHYNAEHYDGCAGLKVSGPKAPAKAGVFYLPAASVPNPKRE